MTPHPQQAAHNAFIWMCADLHNPGVQARLMRRIARGLASGGLSLY